MTISAIDAAQQNDPSKLEHTCSVSHVSAHIHGRKKMLIDQATLRLALHKCLMAMISNVCDRDLSVLIDSAPLRPPIKRQSCKVKALEQPVSHRA